MAKNAPLFEGESLKYFFRIAVGIFILVMPVVILCCYGRLRSRGVRVMVWAHFVLTAVVMFGYICGELSAANWRLTPILGSGIMLSVCGLRELVGDLGLIDLKLPSNPEDDTCAEEFAEAEVAEEESVEEESLEEESVEAEVPAIEEAKPIGEIILSRVCAVVLAAIICSSLVFAKEMKAIPEDYGRDNVNHRLAEFLVEEGLEYGYASFWYSQAVTVLSDSQVRVRNITADKNGVRGRHYQSSLNWYNDQEGVDEYFVILSAKEYADVSSHRSWMEWMDSCYMRHYEDPNDLAGYVIYVFSENILRSYGSDAMAD